MTIRSRSQQELRDSPPPYTMAADNYSADVKQSLDNDRIDAKGSALLPYSASQRTTPPPRRYMGLRTLLLLLSLSAGFTYYTLSSTPDTSVYGEEVNFHSWSASLSWKNKGHHSHSQSKSHSHSWWKSLTGASSHHQCPHRARVQRTVNGMLEALHAKAAFAEHMVDAGDIDSPSSSNATLHTTMPDVAKYLEEQFLSVPDPKSARAALKNYTSRLHVAGTDHDYQSALQIQQEWAELLGAPKVDDPTALLFDAGSPESIHYLTGDWTASGNKARVWTDTYYVWLNYPKNSSLSLSRPGGEVAFTANLSEDVIKEDPTSSQGNQPFHGYSKPGSASGPIVYAGLCTIDDFAALKKKGVKVEGAITLCRYGGPFRGLKVRASADAGAVGTLIYSDPLEDGNVTEANGYKPYPHGPARQPHSVQRGSVQALSFYPGDPGTPGEPSYKNATRLDPEEADSLPKIPSLPISYSNAKPLLEALVGHGVNTAELESKDSLWVGKVPGVEEYWSGPSEMVASMENNMTSIESKAIWNTYAFIPGLISDETVITAVHRDAWTFGGADPSSGTAAMHELVAGLGHLTNEYHWRPMRNILIASWDAEEYGLVGSTEFGEDYAQWLREHAVAYFNTDVAAAGSWLRMGASPSLAQLYRDVAKSVEDPNSKDEASPKLNITKVGPLGSGSDYSVFLQHLGIPSSDIGFAYSARDGDAVYHYHSNYDSFYYMDHFGDPGFKRITTIAKVLGLATWRMSQSLFLQLDVGEYVSVIGEYIDEVQAKFNKAKRDGPLGKGTSRSSGRWQGCHHALFKDLKSSHARLQAATKELYDEKAQVEKELRDLAGDHTYSASEPMSGPGLGDAVLSDVSSTPSDLPSEAHFSLSRLAELSSSSLPQPSPLPALLARVASINRSLRLFEQTFISPSGLKDRPWYKSLLVGPGRWRGYGATPLPGLMEAIVLDGDWDEVISEAKRLEEAMRRAGKVLKRGAGPKKGSKGGRK
ncbi:Zn-dependent exopeptidase [Microstroma glucosiphilum]|uniref:Zn-dependent exopeptidase n=1 Tax=Pseudomicrostroma glucosiphilum TaxID=1684307 RepID=A0A316U031_9BASI|nr:Zn-dependent exopeptidase [Pseudomicrostroma glucosiphilum]PWN18707.1 Zn-dependent exopeptidase [Pseudomicrostroma glucosiphilum]